MRRFFTDNLTFLILTGSILFSCSNSKSAETGISEVGSGEAVTINEGSSESSATEAREDIVRKIDLSSQTSSSSNYLVVFTPENNNNEYIHNDAVYLIYKDMALNHVTGEESVKLKCLLFSSELIGYENFYDGTVKESNSAYFLSYYFIQMAGQFGVFYKDTYYLVDWPMGENFSELTDPVSFNSSSMTISFTNSNGERKNIRLTDLPSNRKIKVKSNWY